MSTTPSAPGPWSSGEAYERYVGRWSRQVAPRFLQWLAPAPALRWADVGCGTGALTTAILDRHAPAAVSGVDLSEGFVQLARRLVEDPRAAFQAGDAASLPWGDATHDMAVSGLVLNFVREPAAMVREMKRVTAPGGRIALYVWDYADGMQMMRHFWDVAIEVSPAAAPLAESLRFAVCHPDTLCTLLSDAGLRAVEARAIDITQRFSGFDDYWQPFLGGTGPAPAYLAAQDDAARQRIRELLRSRLERAPGEPIEMPARAWAVQGTA